MGTGTIAARTGTMPPRPARIGASHDSFSWNGLWLGARRDASPGGRRLCFKFARYHSRGGTLRGSRNQALEGNFVCLPMTSNPKSSPRY